MFFAAYAVLFKLYLPKRYTRHSLRIVTAIAAGIALILILDAIFQVCIQQVKLGISGRQFLAVGATLLLGLILISSPSIMKLTRGSVINGDYVVGECPALYQFFSRQPKDILIASLTAEADNLPTFAKWSVLVSREYANPYHLGFYRPFRQRTIDLINAQYSQDLAEVKNFISKYGIDFWLLDRAAFTLEYVAKHQWIQQFKPTATQIQARLN